MGNYWKNNKTRTCKSCGLDKTREGFFYPNGRVCKACYREKDRIKHKRLVKTSPEYAEKQRVAHLVYQKTPNGKKAAKKYLYSRKGLLAYMDAHLRFRENHPEYSYRYLENWYWWLRKRLKMTSLDKVRRATNWGKEEDSYDHLDKDIVNNRLSLRSEYEEENDL